MLGCAIAILVSFMNHKVNINLANSFVGWHTSEGFALQFIERASEIPDITTSSYVSDVCDAWTTFQSENLIEQEDSGV